MLLNRCPSIFRCVAVILAGLRAETVTAQAVPGQCGYDRWPVKIMADSDRALIDTVPVAATVAELGALTIPDIPYPHDRRMAPHELRIYRVRGQLAQLFTEGDRDWHIVLRDLGPNDLTMIAEIPGPECAATPADSASYAEARRVLRTIPRNGALELTGVGFFDFIHSQRGRAGNGFELHPVRTVGAIDPGNAGGGRSGRR